MPGAFDRLGYRCARAWRADHPTRVPGDLDDLATRTPPAAHRRDDGARCMRHCRARGQQRSHCRRHPLRRQPAAELRVPARLQRALQLLRPIRPGQRRQPPLRCGRRQGGRQRRPHVRRPVVRTALLEVRRAAEGRLGRLAYRARGAGRSARLRGQRHRRPARRRPGIRQAHAIEHARRADAAASADRRVERHHQRLVAVALGVLRRVVRKPHQPRRAAGRRAARHGAQDWRRRPRPRPHRACQRAPGHGPGARAL